MSLLTEGHNFFAVGHLALGYIFSKTIAKLMKVKLDIPLIFLFAVIPDIDFILPFLKHRGPTHSIVIAFVLFLPIFATYKKNATPYFVSLLQHSLIGDYISGGKTQFLWPLIITSFGINLSLQHQMNIIIESVMFFISIILLLKSKDILKLFQISKSSLLLFIPLSTILLPMFYGFPIKVPIWLIPSHLVYATIFFASIGSSVLNYCKNSSDSLL